MVQKCVSPAKVLVTRLPYDVRFFPAKTQSHHPGFHSKDAKCRSTASRTSDLINVERDMQRTSLQIQWTLVCDIGKMT